MRGAPKTSRQVWGALRYGASSSTGAEAIDKYLDQSPEELGKLKCLEFYKDRDLIVGSKHLFTDAQRQALSDRAFECTGSRDPGLIVEVIKDQPGEIVSGAITGALGAEGLVGGIADVIGNALLGLAGLGLVVVGVTRVFGISRPKLPIPGA